MANSEFQMKSAKQFDKRVSQRLLQLGRRLRSYALVGGLASVSVFVLIAAAVQLALDYTFRLPKDMRAALLGLIVILLIVLLWRRVWSALRFPYGLREMACLIERHFPQLRSVLVSAVQFSTGPAPRPESNSPELIDVVVQRACRDTADLSFSTVLRHGRARWSLVTILLVMASAVSAFALAPATMGMWFDRNVMLSDAQWPKRTRMVVDLPGGELLGARGDDLEVRAFAEGERPREVDIIFEFASGKKGRETMIAVGERGFRHTFVRVEEEFRFRVKGGDDETEWFQTKLADRPKVDQVRLTVEPPAYAGIARYTLPADQRAAEALRGSTVTLDIRLNKPVVRADLMTGQEIVGTASGTGEKWSMRITPSETRNYHFALEDELGLLNKRPVRVSIRVLKDAAPRVRMKIPNVSDIITAEAILPLEMAFSDTYGLARAELVYQLTREGFGIEVVPLSDFKTRMTKFDTHLRWPVSPLAVVPGDRLTLFAQAADFNDVDGPGESQSAAATMRVVSRDEFLVEMARREQEYRREFERVVEQQEELRGQLLTLIRQLDDPSILSTAAQRTVAFERRQRQIAGQVNLLRQQFEQIFSELTINGLDSVAFRERLGEGVVTPLSRLAKRELVEAADLLRQMGRNPTPDAAALTDAKQEAILAEMRRILANMLKWEGYQEAVTMLREILRLQDELNAETREELDRRASEVFRDG